MAPPPRQPRRRSDHTNVAISAKQGDISRLAAELVVVDAFEGAERFQGVTAAVDDAIGGQLSRLLEKGDFRGKFKETALMHPSSGPLSRVLLVGLGKHEAFTPERARRAAAVVAKRARDLGVGSVHTVLRGAGHEKLDAARAAEALAEGALLGLYAFDTYRTSGEGEDDERAQKLARIVVVEKDAATLREAKKGIATGAAIADAVNLCRDWAMWSGADAAPELYGERAKTLARTHGLKVDVLDKRAIEKLGMTGLLAVNQGSAREPRFIRLEHAPKNAKHTVVLVGKGITFDSGGISIKPSASMEDMKMDKCGASAVTGAVLAAARLKLPLRVVSLTPFTENLPSGSAYKPGDIVRAMNGKTIEIVNTDAEGRVILSDALTYADRYAPAAVVELSTLTGACSIAVGHHAIAGMGNSDPLLQALREAGESVNERVWPLPFYDEYGEMVKSKVADVRNSAGRTASSITAGKFLQHFIGDYAWTHLDIASTAYHDGTSPRLNEDYSPEQATGVGVRLLVEWMRRFEAPPWTRADKRTPPKKGAARKKAPKKRA